MKNGPQDETSPLWNLTWGQPWIDPDDLLQAIEKELANNCPDTDYRTKLLLRDSLAALKSYWGKTRWEKQFRDSPFQATIASLLEFDKNEPGFPTLRRRVMDGTKALVIGRFLRELGTSLAKPETAYIAGAVALILANHLNRATDDVDFVDEVPASIRKQTRLLDQLKSTYGLEVTHVQSHYLPDGWRERAHSLGAHGNLYVYLVDPVDIFLSKLFSSRQKDRQDLLVLVNQLSKETIQNRLPTTRALLSEAKERAKAQSNWYTLFGEKLPTV